MPQALKIIPFLDAENAVYIDVRSEAEYAHAHIPGAVNIPLLNNENRKIIGTIYKQGGREAAIAKGFELVGPHFGNLHTQLKLHIGTRNAFFYCWRGGMRSNISASVYEWGGHRAHVLSGGYKAYRNAALSSLKAEKKVKIISGFTGVGKTEILHLLEQNGVQVIDLEGLANHRGSALGGLGMPAQVSNEMFENMLFEKWRKLSAEAPIFLENESRKIGNNILPQGIWQQMENAEIIDITVPREIRLQRILQEYGNFPVPSLSDCTQRLEKRLGGLNLKNALQALHGGDTKTWASILMDYYDRTYLHSRKGKEIKVDELHWDWENAESSVAHFLKRFR